MKEHIVKYLIVGLIVVVLVVLIFLGVHMLSRVFISDVADTQTTTEVSEQSQVVETIPGSGAGSETNTEINVEKPTVENTVEVEPNMEEIEVIGDNVSYSSMDDIYYYENFSDASTTVTKKQGVQFKGVYNDCKTVWVVLTQDGKELFRTEPLEKDEVTEWKDAYDSTTDLGTAFNVQIFRYNKKIIGNGATMRLTVFKG